MKSYFCILLLLSIKLYRMKTHETIDKRGLALARDIVAKIDKDPERQGLKRAQTLCDKWLRDTQIQAYAEWKQILSGNWSTIRAVLLDESEYGQRLRQNSPFCGVLTSEERHHIFRTFSSE